jgi:transcriptional regulator with XRE-family HTH domain
VTLIEYARRHKQWVLRQLSGCTGIPVGFLSQLENRIARPTLEQAQTLATALDVPADQLLSEVPEPRTIAALCVQRRDDA